MWVYRVCLTKLNPRKFKQSRLLHISQIVYCFSCVCLCVHTTLYINKYDICFMNVNDHIRVVLDKIFGVDLAGKKKNASPATTSR